MYGTLPKIFTLILDDYRSRWCPRLTVGQLAAFQDRCPSRLPGNLEALFRPVADRPLRIRNPHLRSKHARHNRNRNKQEVQPFGG